MYILHVSKELAIGYCHAVYDCFVFVKCMYSVNCSLRAFTLLVRWQKWHLACKQWFICKTAIQLKCSEVCISRNFQVLVLYLLLLIGLPLEIHWPGSCISDPCAIIYQVQYYKLWTVYMQLKLTQIILSPTYSIACQCSIRVCDSYSLILNENWLCQWFNIYFLICTVMTSVAGVACKTALHCVSTHTAKPTALQMSVLSTNQGLMTADHGTHNDYCVNFITGDFLQGFWWQQSMSTCSTEWQCWLQSCLNCRSDTLLYIHANCDFDFHFFCGLNVSQAVTTWIT